MFASNMRSNVGQRIPQRRSRLSSRLTSNVNSNVSDSKMAILHNAFTKTFESTFASNVDSNVNVPKSKLQADFFSRPMPSGSIFNPIPLQSKQSPHDSKAHREARLGILFCKYYFHFSFSFCKSLYKGINFISKGGWLHQGALGLESFPSSSFSFFEFESWIEGRRNSVSLLV